MTDRWGIEGEGVERVVRHSRFELSPQVRVHVVPEAQRDAVRRPSEKESWRGRSAGLVRADEAAVVVVREQRLDVKAHQITRTSVTSLRFVHRLPAE